MSPTEAKEPCRRQAGRARGMTKRAPRGMTDVKLREVEGADEEEEDEAAMLLHVTLTLSLLMLLMMLLFFYYFYLSC